MLSTSDEMLPKSDTLMRTTTNTLMRTTKTMMRISTLRRNTTKITPFTPAVTVTQSWKAESNEELLLSSAASGDLATLTRLLEAGVSQTWRDEEGQNALIKAVRFGKIDAAEVLLQYGGDPNSKDSKNRTPLYYAVFSSAIQSDDHFPMLEVLISGGLKLDSEVFLMAAYSSNECILTSLMDLMQRQILNRDSQGNCKFKFYGLQLLDDPKVQLMWPDGSMTKPGVSTYDVVATKGKKECLAHPTMMALIMWKWKSYGRRMLHADRHLFLVWLALLTAIFIIILTQQKNINVYDFTDSMDIFRIVLELSAVVLLGITQVRHHLRLREFYLVPFTAGSLAAQVLLVIAIIALRLARSDPKMGQVQLMCLLLICAWGHTCYFLMVNDVLGPFIVTIFRIVKDDLTKIGVLLVLLIVPLAFSFSALVMSGINIGDGGDSDAHQNSIMLSTFPLSVRTLLNLITGISQWPTNSTDPLTTILILCYMTAVPIIGINLLIAMMNERYSNVQELAFEEWAHARAYYLASKSIHGPHRFFLGCNTDIAEDPKLASLTFEGTAQMYMRKTFNSNTRQNLRMIWNDVTSLQKAVENLEIDTQNRFALLQESNDKILAALQELTGKKHQSDAYGPGPDSAKESLDSDFTRSKNKMLSEEDLEFLEKD